MAALALVLCLGGVSYAAAKITTADLARDAVVSTKIKNGTVQPVDLGPAVAKTMQVRAYTSVVISPSMAIDTTRTKGFASVTRPKTGVYCLTLSDGIDASRTAPVVTVDWDNSSGNNLSAFLSKSAHDCPAGADLAVFPVDCVDHDSMNTLKRVCERHQVAYHPVRTASLASFIELIMRLRANAVPTVAAVPVSRFCLRHG